MGQKRMLAGEKWITAQQKRAPGRTKADKGVRRRGYCQVSLPVAGFFGSVLTVSIGLSSITCLQQSLS
jgi:hypothetical protein